MGDNGGKMRPGDLWARLDVAFQVVGVKLDQAGQNEVTAAINRTGRNHAAFGNVGDPAFGQANAAAQHLAFQDQRCIGESRFGHCPFSCRGVVPRRRLPAMQVSHHCDSRKLRPAPWTR